MADDLLSILKAAGFTGAALQTAYAVVMAESGGNSTAHNTNAATGDDSYGLFQINMLGGMGPDRRKKYGLASNADLFDPLTNAKIAYAMSKGGANWGPWTTYTSGKYKQYLGGSGAGVTNIPSAADIAAAFTPAQSGITDTPGAGTQVGITSQSGALPSDVLGAQSQTAGAEQSVGFTPQQKIDQEKILTAAAGGGAPVTTTTTLPTAGLPTLPVNMGQKIVTAAEHYLNTPFTWGGTGPGGVDSSGLIYAAYKAAGIPLPRNSPQQVGAGARVSLGSLNPTRLDQRMRAGDLISWQIASTHPGGVTEHVAIYLGNGYIIEAQPGQRVSVRRLGSQPIDGQAFGVRMPW